MKICFITGDAFNLGGVQRVLSVVTSELSKKYEIEILCTFKNTIIDRNVYNLDKNVKVNIEADLMIDEKNRKKFFYRVIRSINNRTNLLNNSWMSALLRDCYFPFEVRQKFIKYLNEKEYDVVIGVDGGYSILLGSISNKINMKTIGWQHNSYDAYFNTPYNYYWNQDSLFKKYVKNLDRYVLLTDSDKKLIFENLDIRATRIYNPLSFESQEKANGDKKNILSISRLIIEQKGLDLLLEAFKIVVSEKCEWKLKIVGDGEDKDKLCNIIEKLQLNDSVEMTGFTKDVKSEYLNSDIFISSSRWEGFGLTITEAMECGVPVIAFENSGPREIINKNKVNGILVPRGNKERLSEEILRVIDSEEKRNSLSLEGIKRAKDFSVENISRQWVYLIENI